MLGIVNHLAAGGLQKGDGFSDHGQVFFPADVQHLLHMQVPTLAENGDRGCVAVEQSRQIRIVPGFYAGPARRAEGRQTGGLEFCRFGEFEEPLVTGIGTGPAAFDVVDADVIQSFGDLEFVFG